MVTTFSEAKPYSISEIRMWSLGIQREIKGTLVEVRYVGNHSTKLFRSFDHNPVMIRENGFAADFKRALDNGNLARGALGYFDPAYNPNIPGSQPLTIFPNLPWGGLLNNPLVSSLIATGQAGELAFIYHFNGLSGPLTFYQNPYSLASIMMSNYSNASYNALQIDVRHRTGSGIQFQGNYTYGKVLSDSNGLAQHRFEEFRDPRNGQIDRARAPFDITHAIKGNAIYDLPIGHGRYFDQPVVNRILGGWALSGILRWQSGIPFSILSQRGTLTRVYRSGQNTAGTNADKAKLDNLLQFRMTGDGPYIVAASAIGSDGRAVAPDGSPPFDGQVFFHPNPAEIGALQRRWFSGPWAFNLDFALLKTVKVKENHSIEFRLEALNVFNHPTWIVYDQSVSSTNFGRITSTYSEPRSVQLSLHYRF